MYTKNSFEIYLFTLNSWKQKKKKHLHITKVVTHDKYLYFISHENGSVIYFYAFNRK